MLMTVMVTTVMMTMLLKMLRLKDGDADDNGMLTMKDDDADDNEDDDDKYHRSIRGISNSNSWS